MLILCSGLTAENLELRHEIEDPKKWLDDVINVQEIKKEILLDAEIKTLQMTVKTTEVKINEPKNDENYISGYIKWTSRVPSEEFVSFFDFNKIKLFPKSDK